jgi:linoleoyl-CoA desaturase
MRISGGGAFQDELRREVARYFATSGKRQRDVPRMVVKTAIILAWFVASWWLLVFHASSPLATVALAISLGLAIAGIGMGIQHDANHGAYSEHRGVNRALGFLLDVLGASSYVWRGCRPGTRAARCTASSTSTCGRSTGSCT